MGQPMTQAELTGWGRFRPVATVLHTPRTAPEVATLLQSANPAIARGNGLAYGDSAVSSGYTISTRRMNRMLHFEPEHGLLEVECGVTLADIAAAMLPRGWFPPVLPGSGAVTVGGAIAADVHGKNHVHTGSFRGCVVWMDVIDKNGRVRRCSSTVQPDLFDHTLGGMGLTGVILAACLRLAPVETGWICQEQVTTSNFRHTVAELRAARAAPYAVAWLDGLTTGASFGRGVVMKGHHARYDDLPATLGSRTPRDAPSTRLRFDWPKWVLNTTSMRAFNALYFNRASTRTAPQLVDWRSFFFPLDAIDLWPRAYGSRGLLQFQCVLPHDTAEPGLEHILRATQEARCPPFLAVLKELGMQESAFSFPMPGLTLALDFPASPAALKVLDRLDAIVIENGGRVYLAKDARLKAGILRQSDPRADTFAAYRSEQGLDAHFQSAQSKRVQI